MLKPTKHTHPDQTVVFMSMGLLKELRKKRVAAYGDLRTFSKKAVSGGDNLFFPSLNFLFILGLVDYHPKTDSIEYVGP